MLMNLLMILVLVEHVGLSTLFVRLLVLPRLLLLILLRIDGLLFIVFIFRELFIRGTPSTCMIRQFCSPLHKKCIRKALVVFRMSILSCL